MDVLQTYSEAADLRLRFKDIDRMTYLLCERTGQGWVNYSKFLEQFGAIRTLTKSQQALIQKAKAKVSKQNVERVLKEVREVIVAESLDYKTVFKSFDLDGNKRVSLCEFKYPPPKLYRKFTLTTIIEPASTRWGSSSQMTTSSSWWTGMTREGREGLNTTSLSRPLNQICDLLCSIQVM